MSFLYRSTVLGLTSFGPLRRFMEKRGMKLGVRRFVAGESLDKAEPAIKLLEEAGFDTIVDVLGEFVDSEAAVEQITTQLVSSIQRLHELRGGGAFSVKPTQLGLGISSELALDSMRQVADSAQELDVTVCMDMENHPYIGATLDLLEKLHIEGFTNVSTVLQAYMYRTQADLERILALPGKPEIRIVKGAYKEPADQAHQRVSVISDEFKSLVQRVADNGTYVNIATHDRALIDSIKAILAGVDQNRYEFQMLYGVMPALQKALLDEGYRVRIYVPVGTDWYGYFTRRLAEKPGNLALVARGLFG